MFNPKSLLILLGIVMLFSLTNCCTTKNEIKDEKEMMLSKIASPALAPGTAEIKGSIEEIFEDNNKTFCKIKVSSVEKYGPATQPIGVGSLMKLELNKSDKEILEVNKSKDRISNITIIQLKGGMGQVQTNTWKIININE